MSNINDAKATLRAELAELDAKRDPILKALKALEGSPPARRARAPRMSREKRVEQVLEIMRKDPGRTWTPQELARHGVPGSSAHRVMEHLVRKGQMDLTGETSRGAPMAKLAAPKSN